VRLDALLDVLQLTHHGLVDVQSTCGIENHHSVRVLARVLHRIRRDLHRIGFRALAIDRDVELLAEGYQLIDRGWTVHVQCSHQRMMPLFSQRERQLGRCRGLAGTLQARQQDNGGRGIRQF